MGRVLGFVLLLALVVALVVFLVKHKKKKKNDCEKAFDVAEKGIDAYYKTSTSKINDSYDAKACEAITKAGKATAKAVAKTLSTGYGKGAVQAVGQPAFLGTHAIKGDVGGVIGDLTGANAINQFNYGTPIANQSCDQLNSQCRQAASRFGAIPGNIPYCTEARAKGCAGRLLK